MRARAKAAVIATREWEKRRLERRVGRRDCHGCVCGRLCGAWHHGRCWNDPADSTCRTSGRHTRGCEFGLERRGGGGGNSQPAVDVRTSPTAAALLISYARRRAVATSRVAGDP